MPSPDLGSDAEDLFRLTHIPRTPIFTLFLYALRSAQRRHLFHFTSLEGEFVHVCCFSFKFLTVHETHEQLVSGQLDMKVVNHEEVSRLPRTIQTRASNMIKLGYQQIPNQAKPT